MEYITINIPSDNDKLRKLKTGTALLLNGEMYVMRDAAHKRLMQAIDENACPIELKGAYIYYMGPCPAKDGEIIGSAGPTTASRMDAYAPRLYDLGMLAGIGKGDRNSDVVTAIKRNRGVYLSAIGGAGALYKQCITSKTTVAYDDLGAEACLKITVKNFPAVIVIDSEGEVLKR